MEQADVSYASYSSLVTHRTCPQKWAYSSVRGLKKDDPQDAKVELAFGSWWHMLRAADSITRGQDLGSLKWAPSYLSSVDGGPKVAVPPVGTVLDYPDPSLVRKVLYSAAGWWAEQSSDVQHAWISRIGEDLPTRLSALNDRWYAQWNTEIAQERPLAVELAWERSLPGTEGPNGEVTTLLVGYIDEIYLDTKRQVIVVRDHKTSKKLGTQTSVDDMMDSQLQLYSWGAAPIVESWGLGKQIMATTYDRVRSVKPTTPVVTQSGTLSKSVTDYDLATYLEWCNTFPAYPGRAKDGSGAGVYQQDMAVVDKLSTPSARSAWFQRTGPTPINQHLVRAHLESATDSAQDMANTRKRYEATGRSARNLSTNGCKWCDFSELCRAEMFGGPQGDFDLAEFSMVRKESR